MAEGTVKGQNVRKKRGRTRGQRSAQQERKHQYGVPLKEENRPWLRLKGGAGRFVQERGRRSRNTKWPNSLGAVVPFVRGVWDAAPHRRRERRRRADAPNAAVATKGKRKRAGSSRKRGSPPFCEKEKPRSRVTRQGGGEKRTPYYTPPPQKKKTRVMTIPPRRKSHTL